MKKKPDQSKWQPEFFPAGTVVEITKATAEGVDQKFQTVVINCRIAPQRSPDRVLLAVNDGHLGQVVNANAVTKIIHRGRGPMKHKRYCGFSGTGVESLTELLAHFGSDGLSGPDSNRVYWFISPSLVVMRYAPAWWDRRNHLVSFPRMSDLLGKQTFVREEKQTNFLNVSLKNVSVKSAPKKKVKKWLAQNFNRLLVSKEERKQNESSRKELMEELGKRKLK